VRLNEVQPSEPPLSFSPYRHGTPGTARHGTCSLSPSPYLLVLQCGGGLSVAGALRFQAGPLRFERVALLPHLRPSQHVATWK
jgi:hypothetical protein